MVVGFAVSQGSDGLGGADGSDHVGKCSGDFPGVPGLAGKGHGLARSDVRSARRAGQSVAKGEGD
eukprot:4294382-Alexandrium_andersonii.AAC.1